jgi:hypothetical protein
MVIEGVMPGQSERLLDMDMLQEHIFLDISMRTKMAASKDQRSHLV